MYCNEINPKHEILTVSFVRLFAMCFIYNLDINANKIVQTNKMYMWFFSQRYLISKIHISCHQLVHILWPFILIVYVHILHSENIFCAWKLIKPRSAFQMRILLLFSIVCLIGKYHHFYFILCIFQNGQSTVNQFVQLIVICACAAQIWNLNIHK